MTVGLIKALQRTFRWLPNLYVTENVQIITDLHIPVRVSIIIKLCI